MVINTLVLLLQKIPNTLCTLKNVLFHETNSLSNSWLPIYQRHFVMFSIGILKDGLSFPPLIKIDIPLKYPGITH